MASQQPGYFAETAMLLMHCDSAVTVRAIGYSCHN